MSLKVINEITDEIKYFKSIDEFDIYYQKHKEEMNKQTTQLLNRIYKIKTPDNVEYRITKKNCRKQDGKMVYGDVYLRKVCSKVDDENPFEHELRDLHDEIKKCNDKINALFDEHDSNKENVIDINIRIKSLQQAQSALEKKIIEITNTLNQFVQVVNQLTGNA